MKKIFILLSLFLLSVQIYSQTTTTYSGTRVFTGIFRIAQGAQFDFKGNYIVDSQSGDTLATVEGMRTIIAAYINAHQETDPIYSNDSSKLVMWSDTLSKIVTVKRLIDSLENIHNQIALKLNASDTTSKVETRHHAAQTYLGKLDKAVNSELLAGKDSTYIKENWGGGSIITASDGVYMDGTTVKLAYDQQLTTGSIVGYEEEINGQTRSACVLGTKDLIDNRPKLVLSTTGKLDSNNITLELDSSTFKFLNLDTTHTEPLSIMTEAQTKREINATDGGWRKRVDATKYEDRGDSVVLERVTDEDGLHPIQLRLYSYKNIETSIGTITSKGFYIDDYYNSLSSAIGTYFLNLGINGSSGVRIGSLSNKTYFNGQTMGMFMDDNDTLKYGRNNLGTSFDDYFYTTKTGSIGIVSNGVKTYEVDSIGHVSFKGTYASIFRHRSLGDTTQSIPTGTTPTKVLAFSTNGQQSNCTADKTNDKITITKTGRYIVNLSLSYASGTNAVNWTAYIFNGGVECENIHSTGYTATANDKRSTMLSGIINVTSVPADIDYRVTHGSGAAIDLIFTYLNLSVNYIGD